MEGTILRLWYSGFGPFRRPKWDAEPFVWKLAKDGDRLDVEDIEITRQDVENRVYVNGTVCGVPVYFADFDTTKPCQPIDFNHMSVADIQINGKATLVGSVPGQSQSDDAYAA